MKMMHIHLRRSAPICWQLRRSPD